MRFAQNRTFLAENLGLQDCRPFDFYNFMRINSILLLSLELGEPQNIKFLHLLFDICIFRLAKLLKILDFFPYVPTFAVFCTWLSKGKGGSCPYFLASSGLQLPNWEYFCPVILGLTFPRSCLFTAIYPHIYVNARVLFTKSLCLYPVTEKSPLILWFEAYSIISQW